MVAAAANYRASLILQRSRDVGLGGLESRDEAEDDASEDRDGEVEEKNAKIGGTGYVHAAGIGGEVDFHEGAVSPKRKGQAGEAAENGERKTLDQELADDAGASGAHRQTNGDFLDAAGAAHEHEVGEIGARDEQDGAGGGHQHP